MPIVLRVANASFAASIARHFEFETIFSATALATPAFVGLTRFPGARGRVAFAGQQFAIGEIDVTERAGFRAEAIPIATAHKGSFALVRDEQILDPGDRLLVMVPLGPSPPAADPLSAAAERVLGG